MSKQIKKLIVVFIVVTISFFISSDYNNDYVDNNNNVTITAENDNSQLKKIIKAKQSGKIITINAQVLKVLSDDLQGDKHQRIILKVLNSNISLLLAHNIDIAPRVPVIKGDIILVHGQYEWNEKGGVIHWTHRDINNRHPNGWVDYKNNRYH